MAAATAGSTTEPPSPPSGRGVASAASPAVWWARFAEDAGEQALVAVNSDRCADGACVDLGTRDAPGRRPAGWLVALRYRAADRSVVRVEVADTVATLRQPVWFAELAHATSLIPSASLVAFAGLAHPPGRLVSPSEVLARGLRMQERIGEIRWWTRSGVVETVTVAEGHRGQGLGRALVAVAETLRVLRGWAPLTAVGRGADDGAGWLANSPACWRPRLVR